MKVSYPLSLKVSLWLMLNLLLLGGVALGFFVVNGGLRWDALVAGPSGERIQALANVIAGEAAAATSEGRTAVLKRFGAAYQVQFYLFGFDGTPIAGNAVELPDAVRTRLEARPRGPGMYDWKGYGRDGGRRGGDFERGRRREALETEGEPGGRGVTPDGAEKARKTADFGRREPPPGFGGPGMPGPGIGEVPGGRFVVRAGNPAAYWVGLRVPFVTPSGRPIPARLVARVGSLWSVLHLLNLQSWVFAGTAVLVLSILFWLPLVRGITRSVGQLTTATEHIAQGRFETRVDARRRDELGQLGESVNRMAARLDAHITGQKRFLGDVAHELCSPLARLQMATGILSEKAPEELKETVADLREEVQQMSALVNELLAFTKAGMQPRDVALQPVDVASLVSAVTSREDNRGVVTAVVPSELRAMAEPELLSRALGNLVRNAIRYAGEAGAIGIVAERQGNQVVIAVEDEGPGVPPTDIDRLGEPFFRPELARTRETGGVGLGLAIVRNSIAACGGQVRFANRSPRGFRAEVRLPAS